MKLYSKQNVYEAGLERIRMLFDEFPHVAVGYSGGKDSTIIFNLCLQVAKEKNSLPLDVIFIDQEAEYSYTVEQVEKIMTMPEVNPMWFQMPIRIFNATSFSEHWLWCWKVGDDWIRPKHPISIKENITGTDRFAKLFPAIAKTYYTGKKFCYIAGVRAEESPTRYITLTNKAKYKWITWGHNLNPKDEEHFTFYPIYDWSYTDVWKAIESNGWSYNKVYDLMYQHGVPLNNMRVSNLHHETAVHSLFFLQEVDSVNYDKLVQRMQGIDTAGKMSKDNFFPKKLPFMFKDWKEYRDYLLENLVENEEWREKFRTKFASHDLLLKDYHKQSEEAAKVHVSAIMTNDWEFVKIGNYERNTIGFLKQGLKSKGTHYAGARKK